MKNMSKNSLKSLLKERIQLKALKYLKTLRKSKGKEIDYKELQMAEYLGPSDSKLTMSEKQLMFAVRNKMVKIPSNFRGKGTGEEMCVTGCGEIETMKHLYTCSRM